MEERSTGEELNHAFAEGRPATNFWPVNSWWQPTIWDGVIQEVVQREPSPTLLSWLASAQPALAFRLAKMYLPDFPTSAVRQAIVAEASARANERNHLARAAAYRILGELDADTRFGVGRSLREGTPFPEFAWVDIPAGFFLAGDRKEQRWCKVMRVAAYPVTNAQYQCFIDAQGYATERYWTRSGWDWLRTYDIAQPSSLPFPFELPNYPRVGISWYEAMAYTRWLNERYAAYNLPSQVCLPGEFELERAIRGDTGNTFAYGNEVDYTRCNGGGTGLNSTCAVGIFPEGQSPHGLLDATGNVWVWTISTPQDEHGGDIDSFESRVIRSGSWNYLGNYLRCAFRYQYAPLSRNAIIGIRLATLFDH